MIKIEMEVRPVKPWFLYIIFSETKRYTYDPKSCPQRVVEIRDVINKIDEQIEEQINQVKSEINEVMKMKLLIIDDYKKARENPGKSIGMSPKNLVKELRLKTS